MNRFRAILVAALLSWLVTACDSSPSGPDDRPLTEAEILAVEPPDFDVLLLAYDNVRSDNPDVDEESNAFARLMLDEIEKLSGAQGDRIAAAGALDLLNRLTRAEWLIIMRPTNWLKARRMKTIAEAAHARAAAEFPQASLEDGTGDAFRHAYWNVLMAEAFGVEWASEWATAHESETPAGGRKTMDLNNNEVGRNLFSANPTAGADGLAARIKAYPLACMSEDATFDSSRLLYVIDCPTVRVFDDGPDFDDVYNVTLGSEVLGTTPAGGGETFEPSNLVSGTHSLSVQCTVDGTNGGCGFKVLLDKGLTFSDGSTSTPQQVVSAGGTGTLAVVAPTLEQIRQQVPQHRAVPPMHAPAIPGGARP